MRKRIGSLMLALFLLGTLSACYAQRQGGAVAPLLMPGLRNQLYVGFERSQYDYELETGNGTIPVVTNGVNLQAQYRERDHLLILGTARYGAGSLLGERLLTCAGGAGYVAYWRQYEPFVQAMVGYSRLTSTGDMYLASAPIQGFTTLVGAGLDVSINRSWGVRPVYAENQYLPFGTKGSTFWNVGGGVLYRFDGLPGRGLLHRVW